MTTKTIATAQEAGKPARFPDFPPRDDMQNWKYLYRRAAASALESHLARKWRREVIVANEVPIGRDLSIRGDIRIPDLMVAFDADLDLVMEQNGYEIARHGKAPEFILEVASPTTGVVDYTAKRRDYERFIVEEYWRFDPSGGEYHDAPLAGDRLVDGRYEPIPVEVMGDGSLRGYSEVLGLYLCWENGELRFYDSEAGGYLLTHTEDIERADAATARAQRAESRIAELQAELRRLRGE